MERLSHAIWRKRARCLCSLLDQPLPLHSIQLRAQAAWGWSSWFTSNVVCAAEGQEIRARRVKLIWLYGRVPGRYSDEGARELAKVGKSERNGYNAKAPPGLTRRCPGCGAPFQPRTMGQKFCTQPCARSNKRKP